MAKKIIVDNRYVHIARARWGDSYEILPSVAVDSLAPPVSAHPDMALCKIEDTWVAEKTAYDYYCKVLPEETVLCGEVVLGRNYPKDIAYNVLISEHTAFANVQHMDSVLKRVLEKKNFSMISVKQGYAKCSVAVAGKCMITADTGIKTQAERNGFSVLLISQGDVCLSGYDYGFIGGASGLIDHTLFFFGDVTKHRDFEKIKGFLEENRVAFTYIPDFPLTDVGTLIGI